ncbi:hypothetical protein WM24_25040 [Burkholderia ubonensis]|uniref:RHS repeat-associated core domain-containing protein n=1 Tax=Burkholderia ubonensis TaxID=101571 RepID=UPI00075BD9E0|nr:RHS repeat-associated core domain-containing protein [Burkholderia ubonensis]KWN80057.1 hypothetical protein WM24_25040 [Burkholderia ubonensis]
MSEPANRLMRASEPSESHAVQSESKTDTACDSLLDTVKSTFDPFKQTFSSDGSALHHVSEAVNALASLQSAPSQLLNTGIAQIPLLDKMPGMPAATIGVPHLGTPHAHSHPPSSGFPLPSIGATIGSGCLSVLIGGIPAARVLDIGIAPTCGGLTPYFDIQTGSSNTFFGGMRAARMGIDMTRHCNPMGHVGKSGGKAAGAAEKTEEAASEAAQVTSRAKGLGRAGKAWKVGNAAVGPASGGATAADDASQGEIEAAAMMAAQTAADLAMMMLGKLMGKDPGIEPSMGMLVAGNPTVLIGGFPLPDSQMMWHGVKHGIGKKVRPRLPKRLQELACEFWGEPVSAVTGDVRNDFTDYETDAVVPFEWSRFYSSGRNARNGALGYGFRHVWQHELRLFRTRAVYISPRGVGFSFKRRSDGSYWGRCDGYELEQLDGRRFVVRHEIDGDVEFERGIETNQSANCVARIRDGMRSILYRDASQRLIQIKQFDERGDARRIISFRLDGDGRITEVRLTEADGQSNRVARYAYDANGCMIACENALGVSSRYVFDARRRMARFTDANGYSFVYGYDSAGRCVESSGQDGLWQVRFHYQPGRTLVTQSDGGRWSVLYNDVGTVTRVVDPYGGVVEYVLGVDGRIESETDAGGRTMRWLYDPRGRNTGRADRWGKQWPPKDEAPVLPEFPPDVVPGTPLGMQWGEPETHGLASRVPIPPDKETLIAKTSRHSASPGAGRIECRNPAGWVVSNVSEGGYTERFLHDAVGNVVERQDGDGLAYSYVIGSWNLRLAETDPLGNRVQYCYDSKEQVEAIVDANGNESRYAYDYRGRIKSVVRHGAVRETYEYDSGDRVTGKSDGDGNVLLRLEIGEHGLPVKRTLASGETHIYAYDQRGNVTKASTEEFDIAIEHDAGGHLVGDKRDGAGMARHFTASGSVCTTYFDRFVVCHEPISVGETSIHTPTGAVHRLLRDREGRVLLRLGNGVNRLYVFDPEGRCSGRLEWPDAYPAQGRSAEYCYSATGELRRVVDSAAGTTEYQYDLAHRLIGEIRDGQSVRRFDYDRGGNLLSNSGLAWMRYVEGNRLASTSAARYRYDARNHLAEELRNDGCRVSFHYNSADLLTRVEWSGRDDAWTAEYDGLSRRQYKQMGSARTDYYWDGDRLAAEIGPQRRLRLYVYANGQALVPFMFIDYPKVGADPRSGSEYFVVLNQVGLPERIEDSAGQEVWRAMDIDPYGRIVVAPGNSVDYAFRWAGHYFDVETELHYNRFRSYHPGLCRYLQSDPVGQSGGVNLYAYTANPLVFVDVTGLACVKDGHTSTKGGKCEPSCFVECPDQEKERCPACKDEKPEHIDISEKEWNSARDELKNDKNREPNGEPSDVEIAEVMAKKLAKEALDSFNSNLRKRPMKRTVNVRGIDLKARPRTARPCLSVVIDKESRRAYFGQNQNWPPHFHMSESGEIKSDVLIRNRVMETAKAHKAEMGDKVDTSCLDDMHHLHHNGVPGRHAEVHAVVNALRGRGDSNFGSLVLYNAKIEPKSAVVDNFPRRTFGDDLKAMPRCDHCNPITKGVIAHRDLKMAEAAEKMIGFGS